MELAERRKLKTKVYREAFQSFSSSLELDLSAFDEEITDLIKNGHIQKFEYCSELMWKCIRLYLLDTEAVNASGPKGAAKELFRLGKCDEALYESIVEILEARNELSHLYNQEMFNKLYRRLPDFSRVFGEVLALIS